MTDTTTEVTITPAADQVVEAGGNLYKLEALIEAYGDILEQAKQQLENYQPSETEFDKISRGLADRINYAELSYRITETISNDNASYQGALAMEKLVQRVGERLDERRIRQMIRQELESVVNDRFAELRSDVKQQIANELNEERRAVERQNYGLQQALKTVFSTVLLDPLRAEVRHQMDAISAARANAEQG